ncbi:hypothetical protein ACFPRL_13115 [Pseudoclavibacter helvolus]
MVHCWDSPATDAADGFVAVSMNRRMRSSGPCTDASSTSYPASTPSPLGSAQARVTEATSRPVPAATASITCLAAANMSSSCGDRPSYRALLACAASSLCVTSNLPGQVEASPGSLPGCGELAPTRSAPTAASER